MRTLRESKLFRLLPIAAMMSTVFASSNAMAFNVIETNVGENSWLSSSDTITVKINKGDRIDDPGIRFIVNKTDVTALFVENKPGVYRYNNSIIPLPTGTTSLVIYKINADGKWEKLNEYPLQVKTALGFKESEVTPSVNVSIRSEIENGYNGDSIAPPEEEQKQTEMTTNISLNSNSSNDDLNMQTSFNLVGVSKDEEALRHGEKGNEAPKLDLSDYLVEINKGSNKLSIGHISFGNNRFLISGFGSRGISYNGKLGKSESLDIAIIKMNGTSVVGYSNISGLTDNSNHYVSAASVGYDFDNQQPGRLRMELTYLDASLLPLTNFDSGEIPDAEISSGYGIKLLAANEKGSLRGEFTYASSRYTNPEDPFLFQGDDVVAVEEQTDSARHAEMSYEIFRTEADESGNSYSMTATISHERVDPLYKSLAAFASADTQTDIASLAIQLAQISVQYSNTRNQDNIEDLATILKTKTDTDDISLSIPFKQIFSSNGEENNWIPNLDLQFNRTHQYGANLPITFDPDSHIPDQVNESNNIRLSWNTEKLSFGLSQSVSEQDNRQTGRAEADFKNTNKSIDVSYQFTSNFNTTIGFGKVEAYDKENILTTFDNTYSFGMNWNITDKLQFTTNYSEANNYDSANNATRDGYSGNAQLSWQFEIPGFASKKLPGQLFINYTMQNNRSKDNVFISETNSHDWTINAGLSISLF